jgi:hypothetical protein
VEMYLEWVSSNEVEDSGIHGAFEGEVSFAGVLCAGEQEFVLGRGNAEVDLPSRQSALSEGYISCHPSG